MQHVDFTCGATSWPGVQWECLSGVGPHSEYRACGGLVALASACSTCTQKPRGLGAGWGQLSLVTMWSGQVFGEPGMSHPQ